MLRDSKERRWLGPVFDDSVDWGYSCKQDLGFICPVSMADIYPLARR